MLIFAIGCYLDYAHIVLRHICATTNWNVTSLPYATPTFKIELEEDILTKGLNLFENILPSFCICKKSCGDWKSYTNLSPLEKEELKEIHVNKLTRLEGWGCELSVSSRLDLVEGDIDDLRTTTFDLHV